MPEIYKTIELLGEMYQSSLSSSDIYTNKFLVSTIDTQNRNWTSSSTMQLRVQLQGQVVVSARFSS